MKKFLIVALIAILALSASALTNVNAETENTVLTAKVLNFNNDTLYHMFDSPSDVFYVDDGLYVRTSSGYKFAKDNTVSDTEIKADELAYIHDLVTLQNGDITYLGETTYGSYTAISAYNDTLYALDNDKIFKFTYLEGKLLAGGEVDIPVNANNIKQIAATENGCAYVTLNSDKTYSVYIDGKKIGSDYEEEIVDLDFNGKIYVLTSSLLVAYTDNYTTIEYRFPIANAQKLTLGNKAYVLTSTGSIESVSLDLSRTDTLIAAGSDSEWFYKAPVNASSRLGKIYIADRNLGRVAIISGKSIKYITDLSNPVAVTADNTGNVYVAHHGNRIACFDENGKRYDELIASEDIMDINVDHNNKIYTLTESNKVTDSTGTVVYEYAKAFDFQNSWHYMTDEYIDDIPLSGAVDFCTDIAGNIFAVKDNIVTAFVDNEIKVYTIENALNISSVALSKVDNDAASYGDLILTDTAAKCVLIVDGNAVGSANVKGLYTPPELTSTPASQSDGIIAEAQIEAYMFSLPIEGEISHIVTKGEYVIICDDIYAPDPFVYCICDTNDKTLAKGYMYKDSINRLPYVSPDYSEAKINANNTPVYKYPSVYAPKITYYQKNQMVGLLEFAVTYYDDYYSGWYSDMYNNRWYRIAIGDNEGYVLTADTNVKFFSEAALPKTNATITENAMLYRYDEETKKYVQFDALGLYIAKDTRVVVELPFDTSREYTKIVFYREGYGTVDTECYVRTEYIKYDGVDIIKIVAVSVITVALIALILVIIYKRRQAKKSNKHQNQA